MVLSHLKRAVGDLTLEQLLKLDAWLHELISVAEESRKEELLARGQVIEERSDGDRTYRLEGVRCGKDKCKCAAGKLHGPYWYSYTRVGGKLKSQYIGKALPPGVRSKSRRRRDG
jgi:hypothetical protein